MRSRSKLANDAWEALLSAHASLMKEFLASDIWGEVSMREYDVLYTLSKCPGLLRMNELNAHVLLSQPALSRLVDRLITRGLLERTTDPADRRAVLVGLTDEGRSRQRHLGRRHARGVARAVTEELTIEEMEMLEATAVKLAQRGGATLPGKRREGGRADMSSSNGKPLSLVIVSAGVSEPSSTKMLADRVASNVVDLAGESDVDVSVSAIDLRDLLPELPAAMASQTLGPGFTAAVETLADADGIIASAPVYKAGPSGLFISFFQVLDNDLLIGKPTVLAATAGTARHALVVDEQMRSLFAYLRTLTVPTSLFASTEDWGDSDLTTRIERAAFELLLLMESGFAREVREGSWQHYQHEYGSDGGREVAIDVDSEMMRLAAGGSLSPPPSGG